MKSKDFCAEPGKPKFQGGNQKHSGVKGKVGHVTKPEKTFGTPKGKSLNR